MLSRNSSFFRCLIIGLAVGLAGITLIYYLWNLLIPVIFGGPVLTWLQTLGLVVLCRLLFGRWSSGSSESCSVKADWKADFKSKFNTLPPAEREALKEKLREKWCTSDKKDAVSND